MSIETEARAAVGCMEWLGGIPEVPEGKSKVFIVAVEWPNGKRSVRTARYMNCCWLEWHPNYMGDDIDDEGGKKHTGWQDDRLDECGDEVAMELEGKVVAWMALPLPPNE